MADLTLKSASKTYADTRVIHNVNLSVQDGEFIVFVGPSGCGKSTLLRMIAGLEEISDGDILIDGERINDVAPSKRGVSMVFQSYALYPHMTVYDNMAFGLKQIKTPKEEIDKRVRTAAQALDMTDYLDRMPKALSGGQRQRVAIGRAIVREPKIFLFDEPLSNLDAALRVQTRLEIARLHDRLQTTMIYVTHDQVEAMTLADRIVVLRDGKIEQIGSPKELYEHPNNLFVAQFIGSPKMNIFDSQDLRCAEILNLKNTDRSYIGIRPEHLQPCAENEALVSATIERVEDLGEYALLYLKMETGSDFIAKISDLAQVNAISSLLQGSTVHMTAAKNQCHIFDFEDKQSIKTA